MSAKNDCYALFQQVVIARDVFCQRPGCNNGLISGHHLFPGSGKAATDFLPEAGIGLCVDCHVPWGHRKPNEFRAFIIDRMGDRYYELLWLSETVCRNVDYKEVREGLREELKRLKEEQVF